MKTLCYIYQRKFFMKCLSGLLKTSTFLVAFVIGVGSAAAAPLPPSAPSASLSPLAGEAEPFEMAPELRRQIVPYSTKVASGTIIVDTANTYLYFVLGEGRAIRYGIGVGREGFTWSGVEQVTRKAEWPDWTPPADMIARQPYLARFTAGGEGNPLGARAIYLGNTMYRIHGTNEPRTIGTQISSGCIRLLNADVIDLYSRVTIGAKIIVLPNHAPVVASVAAHAVSLNASSANIY
jgi:lipoprotein-anchoring transpeptidase ErfK/SrfK